MKLNYKNISGSPITSDECPDCVFRDVHCCLLCEYSHCWALGKIKGDIFNESIL